MTYISHNGMTEKELVDLSAERTKKSAGCMEPEYYGIGEELRRYGYYPKSMPLFISSEHGICLWDYPQDYNLKTSYPSMLVHSERMKKAWQLHSDIPCFVMKSPFAAYRRRNNMLTSPDATGTLAFFAHSTKEIDIDIDIDKYIHQLSNLPTVYHPVSVCLHFMDIQKGYHNRFLEKSIPVYTAGHLLDPEFINRFYRILSRFKFAISNMIGSYTCYAVEMGIPFSLYGEMPRYFNKADTSFALGEWNLLEAHRQYSKAWSLFEGLHTTISPVQKRFVEKEMGIHDGISRTKMAVVLYGALVKTVFSKRFITGVMRKFYEPLPLFLKNYIYFLRNNLIREAKIATHLSPDEKIALYRLSKELNSKPVAVEIGSYLGASSCFIASGVMRSGGLLCCIDTWQNETMPDGERDTYSEFYNNTFQYRDIIKPLRGRSDKVIDDFRKFNRSIDLLFIDGDHSYEGCKADWDLYSPFLRKGSIVVFHDTGWAEGVNQVIAESVIKVARRILRLPNMQAFTLV